MVLDGSQSHHFNNRKRGSNTHKLREDLIFLDGGDEAVLEMFGPPAVSSEIWTFLKPFFARHWFQRLRVVQQGILATDIEVLCGFRDHVVARLV